MKILLSILLLLTLAACQANNEQDKTKTIHFKSFKVENVDSFAEKGIPYFDTSSIEGIYLDENYTKSYNDESDINDIYVKLCFDNIVDYQEENILNVIDTYSNHIDEDKSTVRVIYYLGNYNNADIALMSCSKFDYLQAFTYEEVAGITFTYHNYNTLNVIYDNNVYSLEDAYNNNILNENMLIEINNNHSTLTGY